MRYVALAAAAVIAFGAGYGFGALLAIGLGATLPDRTIVDVYTDPSTGCEYVSAKSRTVLTPRMGADGRQVCR